MVKNDAAHIREKISDLDLLTKQGKRLEVLTELKKLSRNKIGSQHLPALARLANRNSAYYLAMYFLFSEIQRGREGIKKADPEAYGVFANSLLNLGAIEEATECAAKAGDRAESRLLRAFIGMAKWDYAEALSHLKKYVVAPELTDYQRWVGELNLSAALLSLGRYQEADSHLKALIHLLSENPNGRLLLGNCFELLSQIEINTRNYIEAGRTLKMGREILSRFPGRYLLYLKKWEAVLALSQDPSSSEARQLLENVKEEAVSLRNWETLRDCEFHYGRLTGDQETLKRVYYGTPYGGYRDRFERIFNVARPDNKDFIYRPGFQHALPVKDVWSLEDPETWKGSSPIAWKLFQGLIKDIYRPPRMGLVFSLLYKGEYFNPFTSPQRVRNSVMRFNQWIATKSQDVRIEIEKGDFFLKGPPQWGVAIQARPRSLPFENLKIKAIREAFQGRSFSAQDVARILNVSRRTATTFLKHSLERKQVSRIGHGPGCRYIMRGPAGT